MNKIIVILFLLGIVSSCVLVIDLRDLLDLKELRKRVESLENRLEATNEQKNEGMQFEEFE